MNPAIQELMTQILLTVLQVHAEGRFHAFFDVYGHVGSVNARFYPSNTNYADPGHPRAESMDAYLDPTQYEFRAELAERPPEQIVLDELANMLTFVRGYLTQAPAQGESA